MNEVLIRFNSYEQSAQLFINGSEPSLYSELRNYTYQHFLSSSADVLAAITRELNDDYNLSVSGNAYETTLYTAAAENDPCCTNYASLPPAISFTSKDRAERLGALVSEKHFCALLSADTEFIPEDTDYGNITVSFTKDPDAVYDLSVPAGVNILAFCETHLINPTIGQAVRASGIKSPNVEICARVTPIIQVSMPETLEIGECATLELSVYPKNADAPDIILKTGNADIISVSGIILKANAPGNTTIQAFVKGENDLVYSGTITVQKTVRVSRIEIMRLSQPLHEGQLVELTASVFPADAVDADSLVWESSDPSIAEIQGNKLIIKTAGTCKITAKATQVEASVDIIVQAKLKTLHLSEHKIEVNVGQKIPISVQLTPPDAFDAAYKWETSDKTVAFVVTDDGQEYIKAIGIGECILTCVSENGKIKDSCAVKVNSIMYKRKSTSKTPVLIIALALAAVVLSLIFGKTGASKPEDIAPEQAEGITSETMADNPIDDTLEDPPKDAYINFKLENGISNEDLERFDAVALENVHAGFEEMYEMGYSEITSEPEIIGRYFLWTDDPDFTYYDLWKGISMKNCYAVLVRYNMYHFVYDNDVFWRLYVYPNCYYDEAGNLAYDAAQECVYNLNEYTYNETDDICACLETEFTGMSAKEVG